MLAVDGGAMIYSGSGSYAGGGAGGSAWITAGTLTGAGVVSANGGAGSTYGGGGGGGRIALLYRTNLFSGAVMASGGSGSQRGGAGTIFTRANTAQRGHVLVDNRGITGAATLLSHAFWVSQDGFDLTATGGAVLYPDTVLALVDLRVNGGAVLSHASQQNTFSLEIAGHAIIETNGEINVTGLGYPVRSGPGAGWTAFNGNGGGGGHGGAGGGGQVPYAYQGGGGTYDSPALPTDFGSGAGNGRGGAGGGAIRLNVAGTLQLDGSIRASGGNAADTHDGGGSGGSILMQVGALAGGGTISADGGASGNNGPGGGGGGGRVAIYYLTPGGFDTNRITASGGSGAEWGRNGTVQVLPQEKVPFIVVQPSSNRIVLTDVTFTAMAMGYLPLGYQWFHETEPLPAATDAFLTIPFDTVTPTQAGSYFLVVTNTYGAVTSQVARLMVPANLSITALSAPTNAVAGGPMNVAWTVTNLGPGQISAPWQARLALANDASGKGLVLLGTLSITDSLAPRASLTLTNTVIVPSDITGQRWLVVTADPDNEITEVNEANNTLVSPTPISLPSPDLAVMDLALPAGAQFGETFNVSWTVTNAGNASASAAWNDRLYLSTTAQNVSTAVPLATIAANASPLASGQSYTRTEAVTLPFNAQSAAGGYFIIIAADHANTQPESNEANNLRSAAIALTLPPMPDLVVENVTAPATAQPGQPFALTWTVTNRGTATATAPWSESILVSNATAGAQSLVLLDCTNALPAGAFLVRTQSVVLPITGPAGELQFSVRTDSRGEIVEANEANNLAATTTATQVTLLLTLQLPMPEIAEDATNPILQCALVRNGDRTELLTVTLTNSDSTELAVPTEVAIPAGQPSTVFNLQVLSDGLMDGPQTVMISASAVGYPAAHAQMTVLDADHPHLGLAFATNRVAEGLEVATVLTRDLVTTNALVVTLQSSEAGQLQVPASVVISAGSNSVTFTALAVDDSLVEPLSMYTAQALATGFVSAEASLEIIDNDTPQVTLTLANSTVSEGAGPQATVGTVSRSPVSPRALTLELVSSNPSAALVPATVTIPANQASATFTVAALDNTLADGPHTALIGAYVLASQSSARVAEVTPATLTVTDDDGPALRLMVNPKLLAEGVLSAGTGTVFRNTPATNALVVTLTSSDLTEVSAPAPVTIPIGQSSASFQIATVGDSINDGNQTVTLTATAAGFAPASELVSVSDAELPDLFVPRITVPPLADTEAYINVTYRVANQGFSTTRSNFTTRVFLSTDPLPGDDTLVGQYQFTGALAPGQYFDQTLSVHLTQAAGNRWIIVQTDTDGVVDEALEDNNTGISVAPISVSAAYSARVQTSIETALAGTPVPLAGRATNSLGAAVPFKLVNVHIVVRGTERVISALTDASGNFSATFQPLAGEGGSYQVFATHPGVASEPTQDSFSLIGMKPGSTTLNVSVVEGSSASGGVPVQNLGDVPLTALAAAVSDTPAGLEANIVLATNALPGDASVNLKYTFTAATTDGSGIVPVRLSSAEGPAADVYFIVAVEPLRPRLVATPGELVAGMARGRQATVEFVVQNLGGLATGPISISLPATPWLQMALTNPMPSLNPGASTRVTLLLTPAADLALGPYTGTLAVNCAGATLSMPFNFRCLSEAKGDLVVEAVDQFTFYAAGAPKLTNAAVIVRDAVTHVVVTNGLTDTGGRFFAAGVMEGHYDLEVSASKHDSFSGSRFLVAGQTNEVQAFLPRQTVQYVWKVEPTEIEDRTRISIETLFEAYVPSPVVTITPALIDLADVVGDEMQVDLQIENHGLIAAQGFRLDMPTHALWEFTPLITDVGTIPARGSLTVPLTIRRLGASGAATLKAAAVSRQSSSSDCNSSGDGCYSFDCGIYSFTVCVPVEFVNALKDCRPASIPNVGYVFVPPGYKAQTGGGGLSYKDMPMGSGRLDPPHTFSVKSCEECVQSLAKAIFDCIAGLLPTESVRDSYKCAYDLSAIALDSQNGVNYAVALADCASAVGRGVPIVGTVLSAASCLNGLLSACLNAPEPPGTNGEPAAVISLMRLSPEGSGSLQKLDANPLLGGFEARVPAALASKFPGIVPLAQRADRLATLPALLNTIIGDGAWLQPGQGTNFSVWMHAFAVRGATNSTEGVRISANEKAELLALPFPDGVAATNLIKFVARWNRTIEYYDKGILRAEEVPTGSSTDFIVFAPFTNAVAALRNAQQADAAEGFETPIDSVADAYNRLGDQVRGYADNGSGVCAQVRLRLDQEAVVTRDAFKASLELINNSDVQLRDVNIELRIVNGSGQDVAGVFGIYPPTLENLTASDGTGSIDAQTTGKALWILVPTSDAAPDEPAVFYVSGALSYTQEGLAVTVPLAAVPITVYPSPRLFVKYFHQRDVFSDDPFTDEVEPSIPFNLAVMVQNRGHGVAKNVRITSAQPKIVENEKGLLVDFQIIAMEVAGQNLAPSLTAGFGEIGAGQIAIGRWLLTSTLQGLFEEYKASFEHIDGLGNKKLSLIEEVTIHEMNHLVWAAGAFDDGRPDFLVNEIPDARDLPDTLYLSDGRTNSVSVVETATVDAAPAAQHLVMQLTAPMQPGWTYLRIPEPGNGQFLLTRVVRVSDGVEVALGTNVWTTDRTFLGLGRRPVNEHILHMLDYGSAGTYTLHYALPPQPDTNAPSSAVAALPAQSLPTFQVRWSGQDAGDSGLAFFDVFVSANGGAFTPWLQRTPLTVAMFPGELGSQYAFYSIATDHDGTREPAPLSPDAATAATLTNHPPVLVATTVQALDEGETLHLTLSATDPDGPASAIRYQLGDGAPPGIYLNPLNGQLTWATGEGNGPSTNTFTVIATDTGIPPASDAQPLTVIVREVNTAPVLAPIVDRTINEGALLTITCSAQDFDQPPNTLRFRLGTDAPSGVSLDETNGVLRWRPSDLQGPSTNLIALVVFDNGTPSLSATQQFSIIVRDTRADLTLNLGSTNVLAGDTNTVPLRLETSADLTSVTFVLETDPQLLTNLALPFLAAEVASSSMRQTASNQFQIQFTSRDDASLQGALTLARLAFRAVSAEHSAIVPLTPLALVGLQRDGRTLDRGAAGAGRVFLVALDPILDARRATNGPVLLSVYGLPDHRYGLSVRTNLAPDTPWTLDRVLVVPTTGRWAGDWTATAPEGYFRVEEVLSSTLSVRVQNERVFVEWPSDCAGCELEETTSLGLDTVWTSCETQPQLGNGHYQVELPLSGLARFYRLKAAKL